MAADNRAGTGGVDLNKVTLSKAAPSVDLAEPGESQGVLRVNLRWASGKPRLFRRGGSIDLDLGCLYELADGSKGVVQALGNNYGSLGAPPFIELDGDDRSGGSVGGETMRIDLGRQEQFRRVLIFAFIYEGVPNWAAADGVVTLFPTTGPQIEVRLDSPVNDARSCAIALLSNTGGRISVRREVNYINGAQQALDEAYGWGMQWREARK
ncbi:TerD family protein [Nocardia jiangsuensis]|uniref:Tellurium resistance n=1 Tax=Nocardia jiangsuensis TaxID=1691563 RepID=A0ABV8DVG0_9NOCA